MLRDGPPTYCAELLNGVVFHAPLVANVDKADEVSVGGAGSKVGAVVGRDSARKIRALLLFEVTRRHLEHNRRKDGIGCAVHLFHEVHEGFRGNLKLVVVVVVPNKGIEEVLEASRHCEIAVALVVRCRLVVRQRGFVGVRQLVLWHSGAWQADVSRRVQGPVGLAKVQVERGLNPKERTVGSAQGVGEVKPHAVVAIGDRHQVAIDLVASQHQARVPFGQHRKGCVVVI